VAGTVGAALNGFGISGVAPGVGLVNLRAGQDSGFFFLQATVDAMVYAGLVGIDVINMSFYTDPWLYNCLDNPADSPEAQAEQRTIRVVTQRAINFARAHGVTPVGALGNQNTDLGNPTEDDTSPDFPPGSAYPRDVDNSCITVPAETRGVISISALGPSHKKAHYSNWPRADRLLGPWRVLPRLLRHRPVQPAREPDPVHLPQERPGGAGADRRERHPHQPAGAARLPRVGVWLLRLPAGHVDGVAACGRRIRADREHLRALRPAGPRPHAESAADRADPQGDS
jgi:subtilisin family serine protease